MAGIYWVASYPKSGNTWFRAIVENLRADCDTPADINALETGRLAASRRWIDNVLGFDSADLHPDEVESLRPAVYRWFRKSGETAYLKIHDAYTLTPGGEPLVSREATLGAVYIIRNPLDVVVSAATYWRFTIDETIQFMSRDDAGLSSDKRRLHDQLRQNLLSWSAHVSSWVDAPALNILVIRYEDLQARPLEVVTSAARFLALPHDAGSVAKAIRFSSFEELSRQERERGFKERPQEVERFFREGKSGAWKSRLTQDQVKSIVEAHGPVMRRFGYGDA